MDQQRPETVVAFFLPQTMKRLHHLFTLIAIYLLVGASYAQTTQPNIILIMADDLGVETLTRYGGSNHTPHLDKLAAGGMTFTRAYAMPLCTPSRIQLMTGRYNFRNYEKFGYLNPAEKTFGNLLSEAGYSTCIAGKWQLGGDVKTPPGFGFDRYCLWQLDQGGYFTRYRNPVVTVDGEVVRYAGNEYGEDIFTGYIQQFIRANVDRPFFIYYPMVLTHAPFQPVPGQATYTSAETNIDDTTYFSHMVGYMDKKIGEIVAALEEHQLRERTLILFVGDNGTDRRIYSRLSNGKVVRGDKGFGTEAGTHVPCIVNWPGTVSAGSTNESLVDFTDFFPTLGAAAGVSVETGLDGVSFFAQLTGKKGPAREWIYVNYDAKGRDFPTAVYAQNEVYKLYADGRLFDYQADPGERNDLRQTRRKEILMQKNKLQQVIDRYHAQLPQ